MPIQPPEWLPEPTHVRNEMPGREHAMTGVTDHVLQDLLVRRWQSLAAELPDNLPPRLIGAARDYLVYSVAAQLEDRLFPEQASLDGSNAQRLDLKAGAELARLRTGLTGEADGMSEWSGTVSIRGRR